METHSEKSVNMTFAAYTATGNPGAERVSGIRRYQAIRAAPRHGEDRAELRNRFQRTLNLVSKRLLELTRGRIPLQIPAQYS